MRARLLTAALALMAVWPAAWPQARPGDAPRVAVVAVAKDSPLRPLTPERLRRAFLGLPVRQGGLRVVPLVNRADPLLHEIFLQKVVFLSARTYARVLLSRTLRTGTPRPREFTDPALLRETLAAQPGAVAVLWARDVEADPRLRVLQVLWQGEAAR